MKCNNYISALNHVKEKHEQIWAIIEMFILAFRKDFLLSETIHFYKTDIAKYYGVDKETLKNWQEVFDRNDTLKEIFKQKSKTPISFNDFVKIADVFGYCDIQFYFPNDDIDVKRSYIAPDKLKEFDDMGDSSSTFKNVRKLIKEQRVIFVDYRPYSKKDLIELLDDGTEYKILRKDLENYFKVNFKTLNIIPPKQSYEFIKHILGLSDITDSIAIFNIPKISEPGIRKSQMSLEKRMKKFLKEKQFLKSDYEYRKLLIERDRKKEI